MEAVLKELLVMLQDGKLTIEGVTMANEGYEIAVGDGEGFNGELRLKVSSEFDVIELGHRIAKAMK